MKKYFLPCIFFFTWTYRFDDQIEIDFKFDFMISKLILTAIYLPIKWFAWRALSPVRRALGSWQSVWKIIGKLNFFLIYQMFQNSLKQIDEKSIFKIRKQYSI